jgi:hypothetical protein
MDKSGRHGGATARRKILEIIDYAATAELLGLPIGTLRDPPICRVVFKELLAA